MANKLMKLAICLLLGLAMDVSAKMHAVSGAIERKFLEEFVLTLN